MPAGVSAWTPLANITLGSAQASITFSSISGSYRDLVLVAEGVTQSSSVQGVLVTINGTVSNIYGNVSMEGNGSSTSSTSGGSYFYGYLGLGGANIPNTGRWNGIINFLDYSATDKHKTFLSRYGAASTGTGAIATTFRSTAAITTILLQPNGDNWAAGSTFALYGVSA